MLDRMPVDASQTISTIEHDNGSSLCHENYLKKINFALTALDTVNNLSIEEKTRGNQTIRFALTLDTANWVDEKVPPVLKSK